ncbi:MAG: L,D-transpeptidase family protein [Comamonadaceae bacterium]|nr:L,D-transpeptidase family protein [Comamonadaceae bacterium]
MLVACAMPAAHSQPAPVERHVLPNPESDLVGEFRSATVRDGQTLLDIAREQGIGQEEILNANPGADRWLPTVGSDVIVPGQQAAAGGCAAGESSSICRNTGSTTIRSRQEKPNGAKSSPFRSPSAAWTGRRRSASRGSAESRRIPSWTPPSSIRAEHAFDGEELPRVVPPGPDNPLGAYALRLAIAGYLIHGTDKEFGVGMRVTHGCMRLLPEHIETLFRLVPVGTPVRLMNQPIKLGWGPDGLHLEVHPPLEEDDAAIEIRIAETLDEARRRLAARPDLALDEVMAQDGGHREIGAARSHHACEAIDPAIRRSLLRSL